MQENFFKNIWNKIKTFVSKHHFLFETIRDTLLAILYITWAILVLYVSSGLLLSGLEENSAIQIAFAIAGYIFIAWFTYWITFYERNDKEFRQIQRDLWKIQFKQNFNSTEDILLRLGFKISMLEREMSENNLKYKLEALERKLDHLVERR